MSGVDEHLVKNESESFLSELFRIHGERFAAYRRDWDRASRREFVPDFPLHLELDLANFCNLRCRMCHFARYDHKAEKKKFMPLEMLEKMLGESAGKLPAMLLGSGSECLVHPEIAAMISMIQQAGVMDLIVSTNGVLLKRSISELLVKLQVARLTISLDASTPETFKRIRGGDLLKIEANIREFLEIRKASGSQLPYLRLTFVMQHDNMDEVEPFKQKWLGAAERVDFQKLLEVKGEGLDMMPDSLPEGRTCAHPFQRLAVDYNGDVYPCCTYYRKFLKLGNLSQKSLGYLWSGDEMRKLRESLRNGEFPPPCRKCMSYE
ncbi:MAG: hypothetical protein A2X49_04145 [Lentisphaerae bacterium GWF2_52_8]|nr:MAG: hypothetical protein A2X49_04145 [Lentisphaerae bacterium GWF2_52_8]